MVGALSGEGRFRAEQLTASAGHGGMLALLGGMRSIAASGCWLRANLAWERRDQVATPALIDLTVAADERPLYFWLNGARILANDMPEWRMAGPVPRAFRPIANEEQAQLALRFLEKGLRWHGTEAALYIEMANIHLRRRGDLNEAARYYRLAAEQPGAPYFAARIHAELLRELSRPAEALAWLRQILAVLPADDESARRDVVLERIKLLERELAAP
jgi:tetratricopeptide (TPR) repeat protein